ncbi:capsular polysaccharide biosynthesis protein [Desulfovibrio sulfodismutans]|uniref:Capsular polysaccharide biosynthesis protein n=1 Tax=Desulfolutivibrio sulfodismutans TaxID=63561 RepID=A0A7K3NTB6_9BACT|nr:capsular polysaccharide biosynthesis protein [Desulfolutivibrio sulfodismutans]NDY58499.1 capsular polysaccharide biosynthesis protein [Desulfolutivibrio sulfodismutans]QLA12771.1 capsular polysaccharide biosynthesis protein [Desulfolutivibrio sulfodismutans DSM 3696]
MPERARLPLATAPAALALSRFVATMPNLPTVLGVPLVRVRFGLGAVPGAWVLAWGRKVSGLAAERFAARRGLPVLHVEDGFLRSVSPGRGHPPLSISLDDQGVYYDARNPSRLETLATLPCTPEELARAQRLVELWRAGRVSKYNHAREYGGELPEPFVLAIDQTFGDGSIGHGLAGPGSFSRMLEAALAEHPDKTVVLKVHPEVVSGRKKGHFDLDALARLDRVRVFSGNVHPVGLLKRAAAVYTVTSQVGFEGLMWGRPVSTFGMPFYAGWGLTRDALAPPPRRRPIPLLQLVHAALVDYPRYVDPETGEPCPPERVLEWMALQRRQRERFPAVVHAQGFTREQRPGVVRLFQGSQVRFYRPGAPMSPDAALAVPEHAAPSDAPETTLRVRDGFFPGAGLADGPEAPLCAMVDGPGSRIEDMLATARFSDETLDQARRLRGWIVDRGLTFWPQESGQWQRPAAVGRVVLVFGEDPHVDADRHFLKAVREKESAAYIIYKPHPHILKDLWLGMRARQGSPYFDEIAISVSMHSLLTQVNAVHVRTSWAGIDALLRGKDVFCHGAPFYAGWGLTTDSPPGVCRPRRLSLDELLAGFFGLHPVYLRGETGHFTQFERFFTEYSTGRTKRNTAFPRKLFTHVVRLLNLSPR